MILLSDAHLPMMRRHEQLQAADENSRATLRGQKVREPLACPPTAVSCEAMLLIGPAEVTDRSAAQ